MVDPELAVGVENQESCLGDMCTPTRLVVPDETFNIPRHL
jgi:hypothetical protein